MQIREPPPNYRIAIVALLLSLPVTHSITSASESGFNRVNHSRANAPSQAIAQGEGTNSARLFTPEKKKAASDFIRWVVGGHLIDLKIWRNITSGTSQL
jgi:hypothetical protein